VRNTNRQDAAAAHEEDSALAARRAIGTRLRDARKLRGITIVEAAKKAGLSRSFVAMVESGSSEIAVSRLIRLADVYDISIPDLLDAAPTNSAEFLPANAVRVFPTGMDTVAIHYLSGPSWGVQPFKVDLQPGARLEGLRHLGDEFIHCLVGTPTVVVDDIEYPLRPGDTVTLPSRATHSYLNPAQEPARLIGGVSRPTNHH
jgi:transcriptional regulator with XRE-family HTH domain